MKRWCIGGVWLGVLLLLAACNPPGPGNDALSTRSGPSPGSTTLACEDCHERGSSLDPVLLNGAGTDGKHAKHVGTWFLACELCHDGYYSAATHLDAVFETDDPSAALVSFDALNPSATWSGDSGAGTGSCANTSCHGASAVAWYDAVSSPAVECVACHAGTLGFRRIISGTTGDFASNSKRVSHHVLGSTDPTSAQCQVCHDQSQHKSGTVRLRNADTGAAIAYNAGTPSTLEPFCLSCHDADGAATTFIGADAFEPFGDGGVLGTAPFSEGVRISSYWNGSVNVHASNGLTCTSCHGNGGTVNAHGGGVQGLLTDKLSLPVTSTVDFDYDDYKLCFDCHDSYPSVSKEVVLGYKQGGNYDVSFAPTPYYTSGIQSLFRDQYIADPLDYPTYWSGNQTYNDNFYGDAYVPLHNWHLSRKDFNFVYAWRYRTGVRGRPNCVTCHNVHGTDGEVRSVYAEFGISHGTGVLDPGNGNDLYGTMANFTNATMQSPPIGCDLNCHNVNGPNYYWYAPSNE